MTQYKMVNGERVEMTQAEIDEITQTPAQILEQNKIELINKFESDLQSNALDIASAIAEDGVNEATNVDALRADRSAIKTKFQSDMIALMTGGVN